MMCAARGPTCSGTGSKPRSECSLRYRKQYGCQKWAKAPRKLPERCVTLLKQCINILDIVTDIGVEWYNTHYQNDAELAG